MRNLLIEVEVLVAIIQYMKPNYAVSVHRLSWEVNRGEWGAEGVLSNVRCGLLFLWELADYFKLTSSAADKID